MRQAPGVCACEGDRALHSRDLRHYIRRNRRLQSTLPIPWSSSPACGWGAILSPSRRRGARTTARPSLLCMRARRDMWGPKTSSFRKWCRAAAKTSFPMRRSGTTARRSSNSRRGGRDNIPSSSAIRAHSSKPWMRRTCWTRDGGSAPRPGITVSWKSNSSAIRATGGSNCSTSIRAPGHGSALPKRRAWISALCYGRRPMARL